LRRYARTILPLMPSVAARSSGRNVFAVAMLITSLSGYASRVRSLRAESKPTVRALSDTRVTRATSVVRGAADFMGTAYSDSVRSRTSRRSRVRLAEGLGSVAYVRSLRVPRHRLCTPPCRPPAMPASTSSPRAGERSELAVSDLQLSLTYA
jgi:hypothetical protein